MSTEREVRREGFDVVPGEVAGEVVGGVADTSAGGSAGSAAAAPGGASGGVSGGASGGVPGGFVDPVQGVSGSWFPSRTDGSGVRRAVVPGWLRERGEFLSAVGWLARWWGHAVGFHGVRSPGYWLRLVWRSPVGLGRLVWWTLGWVFEFDQADTRRVLTANLQDTNAYLRFRAERREVVRVRGLLALVVWLVPVGVGVYVWWSWPPVWVVVAGLVVVTVLGWVGRHPHRPVVTGRAVDTATVPPLTADLIMTALGALGIAEVNKAISKAERDGRPAHTAVGFPAPITRDGPGFRADIDLPAGVTAAQVMDARDKLASGLRRPVGCVWPEPDPTIHEGRLVLWVGDRPWSALTPPAWPLAVTGRVNIFQPIPLGTDQRMRPVSLTMMYASGIIGAVPRMGKTATMRVLALAAALDPRVKLYIYNLKGGADFDPFEPIAHAYRSGDTDEDIEHLIGSLRALKTEMARRYELFRELPREVCPDSKVTDDLANRKALGLEPIVVFIDETHYGFGHRNHGPELADLAEDLVKRGPAAGIMVWLATQRPSAVSIPTEISANAVIRICLKVMGHTENDMVLGSGMYKAGIRATMFSRNDLGIAYLAGEGDDPQIVLSYYLDIPTATTITTRARAIRTNLGYLTGQAAGETPPDPETGSILDHLTTIWPHNEPKVWCETLAAHLNATYPDLYHGWTGEQITQALKPHGIKTTQVKRAGTNKRGITKRSLVIALGYRNEPTPTTHHTNHDISSSSGEEGTGPDPDPD